MLMWPRFNTPFQPTLFYWLGGISVFDREETLGAKQFESDCDANIYLAWDETEINNARGFFEDIYRLASEEWREDLHKASLEDQSVW
jgi:hypothetical protein